MKTWNDVEAVLRTKGMQEYVEILKPYIRQSIDIELEIMDEEEIGFGASKMGGLPDLPDDIPWFCHEITGSPLAFLCQINCEEIKQFDVENRLPDSGMIYFFYDCSMDGMPWGFDPADAAGKKVFYYDGDMSQLKRRNAPEDMDEYGGVFGSARMRFSMKYDLPRPDSIAGEKLGFSGDVREKYWGVIDTVSCGLDNKMLGYANDIQGSMELECELVSHGLYCGDPNGYMEGKKRGLDKNTEHWELLLQIDSNESLGMMWGDCGRLYFWITAEDMETKQFGKSWLILQCG